MAELADPAAARLAFTLLRERGADCEILSFREHRFQRRNRVLLRMAGGTSSSCCTRRACCRRR